MHIRQATEADVSRIAEILVFNNRTNFYPIFGDETYSFGEMQVIPVAESYLKDKETLQHTFVYDDGIVRGFICVEAGEVKKLYVDTFFQGKGIGAELLEYAIKEQNVTYLWALEKNVRGIKFYERHGFAVTGEKVFEEGTTEYLVKMKSQTTIERITQMEQYLDDILEARKNHPDSVTEMPELREKLRQLTQYYESGKWLKDYESDERGELPAGLKRGVLAQDTLFDLLRGELKNGIDL